MLLLFQVCGLFSVQNQKLLRSWSLNTGLEHSCAWQHALSALYRPMSLPLGDVIKPGSLQLRPKQPSWITSSFNQPKSLSFIFCPLCVCIFIPGLTWPLSSPTQRNVAKLLESTRAKSVCECNNSGLSVHVSVFYCVHTHMGWRHWSILCVC